MEREQELATLKEVLVAARGGAGRTIVIEAPAGNGKSRLLTVAGDMAREQGLQVLGANASELEQDFPFGIAIQLFEPRWTSTSVEGRAALLEGPARAAGALFAGELSELPSPADQGYSLIHGLFWLASNLLSAGPMVMIVDDVRWADRASLRFLAYLAHRLAEMPIVLIMTVRDGEPAADRQALIALMSAPTAVVLRPGPITEAGVAAVVQSEFPDADDAFVLACSRVTHGNPLLLAELLAEVRADGRDPDSTTAERLTDLAPEAIVSSVVARLGTMPAGARTLACAVSLLGDGASLRHAAELAGLTAEAAARAADGLAAVHMLRPGTPLSFVHPLVRSAVAASMSPLAKGHAHRRAADILREDDSPADTVAAHLLFSPAEADPKAVEILRSVAKSALASGSATSAVRLLERALAEQPEPKIRAEIIAELAEAEAFDSLPEPTELLTDTIELTISARRDAEQALAKGRALYARACYRQAAEVLDTDWRNSRSTMNHSLQSWKLLTYRQLHSFRPSQALSRHIASGSWGD